MPVSFNKKSSKVVVTWPLSREDFYNIYVGMSQKTLKKLMDAIGIPVGRKLLPKECAKVIEEFGLPHENFEIKLAGVKVEVFQMSLVF